MQYLPGPFIPPCRRPKKYNPLSLYDITLRYFGKTYGYGHYNEIWDCSKEEEALHRLPSVILIDLCNAMYPSTLIDEFANLKTIHRLLQTDKKRLILLRVFQIYVFGYGNDIYVFSKLFNSFSQITRDIDLVDLGLKIGKFLNQGAWYEYSMKFLDKTEPHIKNQSDLLECYRLKLYAETSYCDIPRAKITVAALLKLFENIQDFSAEALAKTYNTLSIHYFVMSDYQQVYTWSMRAFELIRFGVSETTTIDILAQTCKACVVTRRYLQGSFLNDQVQFWIDTLYLPEGNLTNWPTMIHIYRDQGYFLLNSERVDEGLKAYTLAEEFTDQIFSERNLHYALAMENVSFASYVQQYNTGRFETSRSDAEIATRVMEKMLKPDHVYLASLNRLKGLLAEEIALDLADVPNNEELLRERLSHVEDLHKSALTTYINTFGEMNLETARQYGNLGRLYHSLKYYRLAEEMHLKAISIKEQILGESDLEVGISVGHLASLYTYRMKKYTEAEQLYLRSLFINFQLLGETCSGLEYDYRGLMDLSQKVGNDQKYLFWSRKLSDWRKIKDQTSIKKYTIESLNQKKIVEMFHTLNETHQALADERKLSLQQLRRQIDVLESSNM